MFIRIYEEPAYSQNNVHTNISLDQKDLATLKSFASSQVLQLCLFCGGLLCCMVLHDKNTFCNAASMTHHSKHQPPLLDVTHRKPSRQGAHTCYKHAPVQHISGNSLLTDECGRAGQGGHGSLIETLAHMLPTLKWLRHKCCPKPLLLKHQGWRLVWPPSSIE